LDWSWARGEDLIAGSARVSVQIDEDMNFIVDNLFYEVLDRPVASVVEHRRFSFDLLPIKRIIASCCCVAKSFGTARVMHPKDGLHEMC